MSDLEKLRKEIDLIDNEMANLFSKRMDVVTKISKLKKENNLQIRDLTREKEIQETNSKYVKDEYKEYYNDFISNILLLSRNYQKNLGNK